MLDALGDVILNIRLDVWGATGWFPDALTVVGLVIIATASAVGAVWWLAARN